MSMARFGIIGREFEPYNDNSDANVLDLSQFDKSAMSLETMRWLKQYGGTDKMILTMWSPPAWMKRNKSLSAEYWATDNKLEPHYYEEYAEHMVAVMQELFTAAGITMVLVCHEPEVLPPCCQRVVLLEAGHITADGPPEQMLTSERVGRLYGPGLAMLYQAGRHAVVPRDADLERD